MTSIINIQANLSASSKEMRAQRLKRLRKTTGLSRKDFSSKYNISPGTLQNWETARFGGLTEKGAHLMISALKCEQVFCSFEWLMYQSGSGPNFERIDNVSQQPDIKHFKCSSPQEDLQVFQKTNPSTLSLKISDDSMSPHFYSNQLVAGTKKSPKHLAAHYGHICIVKIATSSELVLRLLKPNSPMSELCYLIHTNPLAQSSTELNQLYKIDYFAPIEWIRQL